MNTGFSEGEWNGFLFRCATEEDENDIAQLFHSHYFPREVVTLLYGDPDYQDFESDYKQLWRAALRHNLSLLAIHIETSQLAGIRLNYEHTRETDLSTEFTFTSPQMKITLAQRKFKEDHARIFETFPYINKFPVLIGSCIHRQFRRIGLAGELSRRTIELLRWKDYLLWEGNFTTPHSRLTAARVGFVEVARLHYNLLTDEDGNLLLPNASSSHVATQAVCLL